MFKEVRNIWQFILNRKHKWALRFMTLWICLALFHPFIANDLPLVAKTNKGICSPIFKEIFSGKTLNNDSYDWQLRPLIPYSSQSIDLENANYKSPFSVQNKSLRDRHWLGTDKLGRDTLAGLLYGSYFALIIGLGAALLSVLIGVSIGLFAGYFGNSRLKLNLIQLILVLISLFILVYSFSTGFFFGFGNDLLLEVGLLLIVLSLVYSLFYFTSKLNISKYTIPVDNITLRVLEVFKSIPKLFFILCFIVVFTNSSVYNIVFIIALVSWPISCRFTRAETLSAVQDDYVTSARILALPPYKILLEHILPNVISPALVVFAFSVSSAVVLEATLSFLGLGLSVEEVTWGSMLSEVRTNFKAWWLIIFPGLMLFLVVSSMNSISNSINTYLKKMD